MQRSVMQWKNICIFWFLLVLGTEFIPIFHFQSNTYSVFRSGNRPEKVCDLQTGCPPQPIVSGQTVNGTITSSDCSLGDGRFADFYSFDVVADQQINAFLTPNFGPSLSLIDANGVVLRSRGTGSKSNIRLVFRAERAGKLLLRVTSFLRETGPYNLSLSLSQCSVVPLNSGELKNGSISDSDCITESVDSTSDLSGFADLYQINGVAGQQIVVTQNSTYRSKLLILDTNGVQLASEVGSGFPPYACRLEFTPTRTGFFIIATTTFLLETFGNYTLVANADTQKPTVSNVLLSKKKVVRKTDSTLQISWNSTDNVGVVAHDVTFAPNGSNFTVTVATGLPGDMKAFTWNVPDKSVLPKTKIGVVKVTARDAAGNQGEATSASLVIK